ncbi:MAG: hypothetical protein CSYNP_01179 [Syntrophus sp. SKADARSKE-3]|nr:hypothetical protein [Syntrophus sp. SKADARSKE-3]
MCRRLGMGILAIGFIFLSGQAAQALTTDQVLALKKAGVSDQTIRLMIEQEKAAKEDGQDVPAVREIKDKDGNTVTVYSVGSRPRDIDREEQQKLDKAWEMLQHVIIDGRK